MDFILKIALFTLLTTPALTQPMPMAPLPVTLSQGGLIITGMAISLAGLYLICKDSEGYPHKIAHTCGGIAGVLVGMATICLSHELLVELDAFLGLPGTP